MPERLSVPPRTFLINVGHIQKRERGQQHEARARVEKRYRSERCCDYPEAREERRQGNDELHKKARAALPSRFDLNLVRSPIQCAVKPETNGKYRQCCGGVAGTPETCEGRSEHGKRTRGDDDSGDAHGRGAATEQERRVRGREAGNGMRERIEKRSTGEPHTDARLHQIEILEDKYPGKNVGTCKCKTKNKPMERKQPHVRERRRESGFPQRYTARHSIKRPVRAEAGA